MRAALRTAYSDSRAADLSLAYGLRPLPALGTHVVRLAGLTVELRVLGASHQVLVRDEAAEQTEAAEVAETVACLPDRSAALPARTGGTHGPFAVEFTAVCHRLEAAEFAERVNAVARRCAADERALLGEFPGAPLAVTALLAEPGPAGGARWRTWHAYPQAGELVETVSVVSRR